MSRVAVQVGGAWLRVATEGRLLAARPAGGVDAGVGGGVGGGVDLAAVLDGLLDAPVDELLVVLPAGGTCPAGPVVRAGLLHAVPAAVAALAGHAASTGAPLHRAVVVDVGHRGAEVARVEAGRVVAVRRVPVGGARLDAVTADVLAHAGRPVAPARARRVREALSLLPAAEAGVPPGATGELHAALAAALSAVVETVRVIARPTGSGPSPPVLLIGGVARSPLLAELLDAAGIDDVRVAHRPDATAVTGALLLPEQRAGGPGALPGSRLPGSTPPGGPAAGRASQGRPGSRAAVGDRAPRVVPANTWLPPVAARRRPRRLIGVLAAAAAFAGLLAAGATVPGASRARPAVGELVQYGYAVDLPEGWAHTGGLPERRRSLLTPVSAPDGSDLISVERTPLGYDADAEPQRARSELRATFDAAVASGAPLSGFTDDAHFAGRPVVVYREGGPSAVDVDWYVLLVGDTQLSVGCRHTRAGADAVRAACTTVVGSARRTA